MKPPFGITPRILRLCTEITRLLGQVEGMHISKPEPKLRRASRIKTIHASLGIEGNTLEIDQVTALVDGKRVLGPKREVLEVTNAIKAYDRIASLRPHSSQSLRDAHGLLMAGLVPDAGKWRQSNVGIFQGQKIAHAAPQAKRVPELMDRLFAFLKADEETHPLILSSVFHYELEFIHPFTDGNGRIGRLWQTVLLSKFHPIFEFTPVESVIRDRQTDYYVALAASDRSGDATPFIEFSLTAIFDALEEMSAIVRPAAQTPDDRISIARQKFGRTTFSRKDYLTVHKTISTATASRDLAYAVKNRTVEKSGTKALTKYRFTA